MFFLPFYIKKWIFKINKNDNMLSNKGSKSNFYKIIGVLLHNETTTNQLHIYGFNNLFYVWSSN